MINWTFLLMQACLAFLIGLTVLVVIGLVKKILDARRKVKLDRRIDGYLPKIKAMNAETVERRRHLLEDIRTRSPFIKIVGKRQAAYWNSVLNALAECRPMDDDQLVGIAVLFASLEESFGREVTPDHLVKEARLIAKAERNWRRLLDLLGPPNPQA